jgi:uncharacterized Zn finger protein
MDLSNWKELFPSHILARGKRYYEEGRVAGLQRQGDAIQAVVQGSESYRVKLDLELGQLSGWHCSCPYAEDSTPCKHLAAVFCALEHGQAEETAETVSPSAQPAPLSELIEQLTLPEAKALLLKLAAEYEPVADQIRLHAERPTAEQMERWKDNIDLILYQAAGRGGFIDYDHAWRAICDLEEFLVSKAVHLMEIGHFLESFSLTGYGFCAAGSYDMDDSDGGLTMFADACFSLWEKQTAVASAAQQKEMFQWFAKTRKTCKFDYYQERLLDAQLSLFHEPELLQKNLELVDQLISAEKAKDRSWNGALAQLAIKRLNIMEELGAPQEILRKTERAYWSFPEIRQRALERHLASGETAEAEVLLRESKELDSGSPGLVCQHSKQLIELYQENEQTPQLLEELTFQVLQCPQSSLNYVKLLKACVPSEQWPELFERLLSGQTSYGIRGDLLEMEGQYDRLFQYVVESDSLWTLDRWESILKPRFPEQLRDAYEKCLDEQMRTASNRKQYAAVISYLKKLRSYPDGEQSVTRLVSSWLQTYPRRRSMIDELRKA